SPSPAPVVAQADAAVPSMPNRNRRRALVSKWGIDPKSPGTANGRQAVAKPTGALAIAKYCADVLPRLYGGEWVISG
ncbi:MAG TPA: hypothetical protein PKY87_04030, partial [Terricaulis sp.]|nr:hypothetical protein [Terricaulis sp.]